jgi:large subunit ribosomal protein L3
MLQGFMAYKVRMTRILTKEGMWKSVTLLYVPTLTVLAIRKYDKHTNIQIGTQESTGKTVNKPQRVELEKLGLPYFKIRKEIEFTGPDTPAIGSEIVISDVFKVGDVISVRGRTIGHGTAGVMKRWNFKGLRASHGVSLAHRSAGSTGSRNPNRTFKDMKMAGQYGNDVMSVHGVRIMDFDQENSILAVRGSVPSKQNWLELYHRA